MVTVRYLAALLLSVSAAAAPVTLRWANPTAWTDGAPTTITVEWQSPAVCTTTCAVTRTR